MYFAMDEIGIENTDKIKTVDQESDRWKFIYDVADTYGFDGIHFTPSLYKTFNLSLKKIPDYFKKFKLTFHFGGMYKIISENDYKTFNNDFNEAFEIAVKYNMQDISIHPPFVNGLTSQEKELSLEYLCKFMDKWLTAVGQVGISLSLESHVSGKFFQFDGLNEYIKFIDTYPNLGVLIDFAHNYYDGYSEDDIIQLLGNKNIKGLHISDAIHGSEFDKTELRNRTHLAVGDGAIDFQKLLKVFDKSQNQYGALEIKSKNEGLLNSINNLKHINKINR